MFFGLMRTETFFARPKMALTIEGIIQLGIRVQIIQFVIDITYRSLRDETRPKFWEKVINSKGTNKFFDNDSQGRDINIIKLKIM
jgi:hypothetical protein